MTRYNIRSTYNLNTTLFSINKNMTRIMIHEFIKVDYSIRTKVKVN